MKDFDEEPVVEVEITGELDLHHFSPKDLKYLIPDYLEACLEKNITEVRLIHGKGKGVLRRSVHSLLEKHPDVDSYKLATEDRGNWGATIVTLISGRDKTR